MSAAKLTMAELSNVIIESAFAVDSLSPIWSAVGQRKAIEPQSPSFFKAEASSSFMAVSSLGVRRFSTVSTRVCAT